jgi:hypothetical protein
LPSWSVLSSLGDALIVLLLVGVPPHNHRAPDEGSPERVVGGRAWVANVDA